MTQTKKNILGSRKCLLVSYFLLSTFISFKLFAQGPNLANNKKSITAEFLFEEVEFKEIALMTNVLKVKNNNGKNYTFTISLNIPNGWKSLVNEEKEYVLKPNDSVFVPVRILTTNKKARGGTKYSISAYVNTNEGKQMAYARFTAGRPKVSNWQMHVLPRPRIYFLNGENKSSFQLNITNEGDENQEVLVSLQKQGTDLIIKDSSDKILKRNYLELNLAPFKDTTISYNVEVLNKMRNQKRVDTWSYNPYQKDKERRFGVFLRASEVRLDKNGTGEKNKKVDFVKLANSIDFVKLNNSSVIGNGSNSIPLTVFANFNNILGQQPIANIVLQGNSQVGKYSSLNYQIQTGFLYYRYSNEYFTNRLNANITYTFKKGFVGFITSGFGLSGESIPLKTIIGQYFLSNNHAVSGFIARQRFFGQSSVNGLGLGYSGTFGRIRMNLMSGVFQNPTGIFAYNINSNVSFFINSRTNLVLFGIRNYSPLNTTQGSLTNNLGLSFNTSIKNYSGGLTLNYFSNEFTLSPNNSIFIGSYALSLFNTYRFKKGPTLQLTSSYNIQNSNTPLPTTLQSNFFINNILNIIPIPKNRPVQFTPSLYFDYIRFFPDTLMDGGVQLNISKSNFENNFFAGGNARMGYNTLVNRPELGSIFTLQSNVFVRYRVWNIIGMYNYGPFGPANIAAFMKNPSNVYPQTVRISIGHQFQFKNLRFVFENNPTYFYVNTVKRHSLGLFSQLFYFTDNNFRVSLNAALNFTSGLSYIYDYTSSGVQLAPIEGSQKRSTDKSLLIGFTLKKDFAIPVPKRFRNKKYCDANFVVFLDVNGNGKMEPSEVPVENIVLRMGEYEVITDEKGKAGFINASFAKYHVQVIPLIDMGSWFPNIEDSVDVCGPELMYIPFTKGTQVYGTVELDHESYSGELFDKLDVSRFKIYMIDSSGRTFSSITDNKGNFSFYVPHARYTLKFDEKVLGSSFYLPENDIPLDLRNGIESYYHHFLIIQKKRKVKKKIFGPDGKVTYLEEESGSMSDKNKSSNNNQGSVKDKNKSDKANSNNKNIRIDSLNMPSESKLDSLIELLNNLMSRMASKNDVRSIVKQEVQNMIDQLNATFTIYIDELPKGTLPTGLMLQMIRLNKIESFQTNKGSTIYFSGDYKNINEAEKYCRDYQTSGFRKSKVINRKQLLKKAKK